MNIDEVYKIIEDRKKRMPKNSYVAELFKSGDDRIIQKVGEEAVEAIIAAKNKNKKEVISETADLWFHSLVMLSTLGISIEEIYKEFTKRHKK